MSDFMRVAELAETFKVDVKTAGRWCKDGKIPGVIRTPGGQWRIPRAEVAKILAGSKK